MQVIILNYPKCEVEARERLSDVTILIGWVEHPSLYEFMANSKKTKLEKNCETLTIRSALEDIGNPIIHRVKIYDVLRKLSGYINDNFHKILNGDIEHS